MNVKPLLRNAARLGLLAIGGVVGAVAVVWVRANSDWAVVRLPSMMAPGSTQDIEYEARVYGIVAIAFGAGLLTSMWLAVAVWLRAMRRERRLIQNLEQVERQVASKRAVRLDSDAGPAKPSFEGAPPEPGGLLEGLADLDDDPLLSDAPSLPPAYYEPGDDEDDAPPEREGE